MKMQCLRDGTPIMAEMINVQTVADQYPVYVPGRPLPCSLCGGTELTPTPAELLEEADRMRGLIP